MSIGTNSKIEKYNPERIELIKLNLEQHAEAGNPREYEIQVDGLKAVWRTNDLKQFDNYQLYITDEAEKMKILLFQGTSHKYDSFVFLLNGNDPTPSLQGVPLTVEEKIHQALRDKELLDCKQKIEELQSDLDEAIEYQEKLEDKIQELESQKPDKSERIMNWILTYGENMMKTNPSALRGIPLIGDALAGTGENMIVNENQALRHEVAQLKAVLHQLGYTTEAPNTAPNTQTKFEQTQANEEQ